MAADSLDTNLDLNLLDDGTVDYEAALAAALTVETDQADYAPGSTATITVTGVTEGGSVTIDIADQQADPGDDGVANTYSFTVVDGSTGDLDQLVNSTIVAAWTVPSDGSATNATLDLTVTDDATGAVANTVFTDGPKADAGPPPPPPSHGVLLAPTGTAPTGAVYNPTHWSVLDGDTIAGTIVRAADAVEEDGTAPEDGDTVLVLVKSTDHGNTQLNGTFDLNGADNIFGGSGAADDYSITFTWTVQSPDGSDICETTVVAYQTGVTGGGDPKFENVSSAGTDRFGFAIVNADGTPHECDDDGVTPTLSLTKDTVCADDGDSVNGGTLLVGNLIEWVFTLTAADGSVSDITLTDNQNGTDFVIYDDNGDGIITVADLGSGVTFTEMGGNADDVLDQGEVWTFRLGGEVVRGAYSNTATATGNDDATGAPVVEAVSEENTYTGVRVAEDSITVVKEVSVDGGTTWFDANDPDTAPTLLDGYDDPQYRFTITNSSDVSLDIRLVDAALGIDQNVTVASGGSQTLAPVTGSWAEGLQTNTVEVSATFTDDCENTASASGSDVANYIGAAPSIGIEKNIVCDDGTTVLAADDTVKLLKDGDGMVEYQIVVTNTGNVALSDPSVTDTLLALGSHTDTGGTGDNTDDILDVGETWTYTVLAAWAAGGPHVNTAEVEVTYVDGALNEADLEEGDSATYFGLDPHITLTKLTNGSDGPDLLQGQAVTWTYDVTNDGNVDLSGVGVTDIASSGSVTPAPILVGGFNSGDLNQDGMLNADDSATSENEAETWHFSATGTAVAGAYTNTATATTDVVSDDCGDSVTPTDYDVSSYTGHARAAEGLTKGYWATHATLWDVVKTDSGGVDLNPAPQYNWNGTGGITNSAVVTSGPASSRGLVSGANNGGGDSGLLMGDLNHNGLVDDAQSLFLDLASAQALANSSVVGDARIILAGQAVAAQLNQYQAFVNYGADSSPDDLINDAVQRLKGQGPLSFDGGDAGTEGDSNVNTIIANDVGGVATVINRGTAATNDYTLSGSAITLKGAPLSSSSASWQTMATVFSETAGYDINGDGDTLDFVKANGEGLKNALAAYNHGLSGGTQGFVTSQDGTLIGWEDSIGGTPYDVHANDPDVFWGILANHNITGVSWVNVDPLLL